MSVPERISAPGVELPQLRFLDGLRGSAALYVVLHHAALMIPAGRLGGPGLVLRFLLRHGHSAVAVFIVLSGYCLMLPYINESSRPARVQWRSFFRRRARRIVPPYFGALLLCGILIALLPELGHPSRSPWDRALPARGEGIVLSHIFLVQNLSERWMFKVDPPMWSVATEWQIYFLFPWLIWLWRKYGIIAAIALGFAAGYGVAALESPLKNPALRELCPWFAGLFALGMTSALVSHRVRPNPLVIPGSSLRISVALVFLALIMAGLAVRGTTQRNFMVSDPIIGLATACLLARWTRRSAPGSDQPRPPLLRGLEGRWLVGLGSISYSLYLIHYPLLAWMNLRLRSWQIGSEPRLWLLTLVGSLLTVLAAALFARIFERPFQTRGGHAGLVQSPKGSRLGTIETESQSDRGSLRLSHS